MRMARTVIICFILISCASLAETKKKYDSTGELVSYERDSNGDGKIDVKYRKITPGPDGQESFAYDRNGDGTFEEKRDIEFFQGRVSREVASFGIAGNENRANEIQTSTFLHSQNKISVLIEKDPNRSGNFEFFKSFLKDDLPTD